MRSVKKVGFPRRGASAGAATTPAAEAPMEAEAMAAAEGAEAMAEGEVGLEEEIVSLVQDGIAGLTDVMEIAAALRTIADDLEMGGETPEA